MVYMSRYEDSDFTVTIQNKNKHWKQIFGTFFENVPRLPHKSLSLLNPDVLAWQRIAAVCALITWSFICDQLERCISSVPNSARFCGNNCHKFFYIINKYYIPVYIILRRVFGWGLACWLFLGKYTSHVFLWKLLMMILLVT